VKNTKESKNLIKAQRTV